MSRSQRTPGVVSLWAPVVLVMVALFVVSGQSNPRGLALTKDYVLHALAYGVLGLLASRALHGGLGTFAWPSALGAIGIVAGYGAIDEVHQAFVPGRFASVSDWFADLVGAVGAVLLAGAWLRLRGGTARSGGGTGGEAWRRATPSSRETGSESTSRSKRGRSSRPRRAPEDSSSA